MDDVRRELATRQRIAGIFTKPRGAFDSQEAYDSYLETVEDIVYKLSNNIDVAEVEQQIQDYIRQEAASAVPAAADAGAYVPAAVGTVLQPVPLVPVLQDAEGRMTGFSAPPLSGQQWQAMADASGWSKELITQRALQEAFAAIFVV